MEDEECQGSDRARGSTLSLNLIIVKIKIINLVILIRVLINIKLDIFLTLR